MSIFKDILGTVLTTFRIGITGNTLESLTGRLRVRDGSNAAFSPVATSRVDVAGDTVVLNSETANTYTLRRPASQSTPLTITWPATAGTAGQAVITDGLGNWTYASAASTADREGVDTTSLAFGDTSPKAMFNLPVNAVVNSLRITIDTAFNGNPSLSVGIAGNTSKYLASTLVDLRQPATTIFEIYPGLAPVGTVEALIASYSAGGATVGSARIEVFFCNPN